MYIDEFGEKVSKGMKYDIYVELPADYTIFRCQHVESYLRTEVNLVETDIRLVLGE